MGYLNYSNGFHYFEIKCFLRKRKCVSQKYCLCSLLSNCCQALLWTDPISFMVNYNLICLVSVISDAILTFVIKFCFFKTYINFLM